MRAFHPDPESKAVERQLAAQLAQRWRCEVSEFPALSPIDWYLHREQRVIALAEIKQKHRAFEQYGHLRLDVLKYWPLLTSAVAFNVPGLYLVKCLDGVFFVPAQKLIGLTVQVLGRRDRDDPLDVEPCIAIPTRLFKRIHLEEPCSLPTPR